MKKAKVDWYARGGGIAKTGPFSTQAAAAAAIMTVKGVPAEGAFVWSEVKKGRGK